jgi:thiamine biosynthesis lipoprotein
MIVSRRRFLGITAAAAGLPVLPIARGLALSPQLRVWKGTALGCDAVLQIHHPDAASADGLIAESLAEIRRLERIMSIYQPESALSRLNRTGLLEDPPFDLVRVLSESRHYSLMSEGAFDATVQPLWDVYAGHFSRPNASPDGPPSEALAAAVEKIGHDNLDISPERLRFGKEGMGVTLNGVGQGYVTDRIVELLRREGVTHALVNMGKTRAIGGHPEGGPWSIGLEDPRAPGSIAERIPLADRSVATAGGYGTLFDAAGRFNHIFEPWSGRTSWRWQSDSVESETATDGNALSNAFALMPAEKTEPIVRSLGLVAHFVRPDGSRFVQRA